MKKLVMWVAVGVLALTWTEPSLAKSKKKKSVAEQTSQAKSSEEAELANLEKKSEKLEKAESQEVTKSPDGKPIEEDKSIYTRAYREKLDAAAQVDAKGVVQGEKDRAREVQYQKHMERLDSMDRKGNRR